MLANAQTRPVYLSTALFKHGITGLFAFGKGSVRLKPWNFKYEITRPTKIMMLMIEMSYFISSIFDSVIITLNVLFFGHKRMYSANEKQHQTKTKKIIKRFHR